MKRQAACYFVILLMVPLFVRADPQSTSIQIGPFLPSVQQQAPVLDCSKVGFRYYGFTYNTPQAIKTCQEPQQLQESGSQEDSFQCETPWGPVWGNAAGAVQVCFTRIVGAFDNELPIWTWKFKNVSLRTVTYLSFMISSPFRKSEHDVMPVNLRPGRQFGGWAAFTYASNAPPSISAEKLEQGD